MTFRRQNSLFSVAKNSIWAHKTVYLMRPNCLFQPPTLTILASDFDYMTRQDSLSYTPKHEKQQRKTDFRAESD